MLLVSSQQWSFWVPGFHIWSKATRSQVGYLSHSGGKRTSSRVHSTGGLKIVTQEVHVPEIYVDLSFPPKVCSCYYPHSEELYPTSTYGVTAGFISVKECEIQRVVIVYKLGSHQKHYRDISLFSAASWSFRIPGRCQLCFVSQGLTCDSVQRGST